MPSEERGAPDFYRLDVRSILTAYYDPSVDFDIDADHLHANVLELKEPRIDLDDAETHPEYTHHIAALVGMLDHRTVYIDDEYNFRREPEDFGAVVCAEIYRQVLGIKNYPQLVGHLRRMKYVQEMPIHEALGFDEIPHENTFRKASDERFNDEAVEFIKRWADRLSQLGLKRGYEFPDLDQGRLTNNGGILDIPVELKRGYAHGVLDRARDNMPISKSPVAKWDDYTKHFDFSLHLCDTNGTPEGELENFADNRGLQKGVDIFKQAETFRTDIFRTSIEVWEETFTRWTEDLIHEVYDKSLRSRELPLAIDATNIPTWSNEQSDLPGVIGTEKLSNTHYAYRILSAQAVSDGMPFQISHQLQMSGEDREDRLEALLDSVEERGFNIGLIMADSEFASGRVVNRLKSMGVNFVIAYPKHHVVSYTDDWEDEKQTFGVEDNYIINKNKTRPEKADVTLFGEYHSKLGKSDDTDQSQLTDYFDPEAEYVTEKQNQKTLAAYEEHMDRNIFEESNRKRWFTFITDLDVDEDSARALRSYYHYRWAIESAFGVYKDSFLPKTKSTELGMRTYLYLFGMYAYNAWVAANTRCRRQHLEDSERNRPPIRASRFMTLAQQRYRDEFHVDYVDF